ncbi:methyltransferase domain-containing protein [Mesobacillus foraminis]|uniref:tRNA (mnm(5)s(2)U34)-methyltransferase n=1 Tax=Mesobacillus foraminis TaxID=279826 RepID=UPI001BECDF4E|nr:class I SAM-dependent methyltransferase [Mesobacillus foraminis]MBT2754378.1 methyltransferase domain-containing protein [Mesobacillus foraminis]
MKLERILPFMRTLLEKAVSAGDVTVDATVGNGHDTLFLANLVGPEGKVYGFDIQEEAIQSCSSKLSAQNLNERVSLFQKGHEHVKASVLEKDHGKITGAVFNLGYLPGGDKSIVTGPTTTIAAVEQLLDILAPEGIIVIVIYHGHPEGQLERDSLLEYVKNIKQDEAHVLQYQFINQQNHPPFILAIEKR